MENPRPEKVAVVEEVKDKFQTADAVIITEYRGLTVRDLQDLRTSLREAGGEIIEMQLGEPDLEKVFVGVMRA